ncbi:hypothetical protein BGZ67_010405 [Mortierella alpina]|nr:hypothetical protein BGZ67_010405 [Mortierella alpina]
MSFLLDVADPSIHFRARQGCNSTGSKPFSSLDPSSHPSSLVTEASSIPPLASSSSSTATAAAASSSARSTHLFPGLLPPTAGSSSSATKSTMFATMSRMIRTASNTSSTTMGTCSLPSTAVGTPTSSRPTTPEAVHVSDPFLTVTNGGSSSNSSSSSHPAANRRSGSLSPWMMPSVCDDDQMNKLVSFQL